MRQDLAWCPVAGYTPIYVLIPAGVTLPYSQLFLPRLGVYFLSRIVIFVLFFLQPSAR